MLFYDDDLDRVFEIVDKIPPGYFVWNIPRSDGMKSERYIPLGETDPEDESRVNTHTLKVIQAQTTVAQKVILRLASYGLRCLEDIFIYNEDQWEWSIHPLEEDVTFGKIWFEENTLKPSSSLSSLLSGGNYGKAESNISDVL